MVISEIAAALARGQNKPDLGVFAEQVAQFPSLVLILLDAGLAKYQVEPRSLISI